MRLAWNLALADGPLWLAGERILSGREPGHHAALVVRASPAADPHLPVGQDITRRVATAVASYLVIDAPISALEDVVGLLADMTRPPDRAYPVGAMLPALAWEDIDRAVVECARLGLTPLVSLPALGSYLAPDPAAYDEAARHFVAVRGVARRAGRGAGVVLPAADQTSDRQQLGTIDYWRRARGLTMVAWAPSPSPGGYSLARAAQLLFDHGAVEPEPAGGPGLQVSDLEFDAQDRAAPDQRQAVARVLRAHWPVDVNVASEAVLGCVPGVGRQAARRIIEARQHSPLRPRRDLPALGVDLSIATQWLRVDDRAEVSDAVA